MIFQSRARCATPRVLTVGFHLLLLAWAQPGAAQSAKAAEAPTLPSIEVAGSAEDDGLMPRRASSATRSDLPLGQIAQSVSVVTRAQMDAQDARSINEAFRYAPGIATEQWGSVTAFDQLLSLIHIWYRGEKLHQAALAVSRDLKHLPPRSNATVSYTHLRRKVARKYFSIRMESNLHDKY